MGRRRPARGRGRGVTAALAAQIARRAARTASSWVSANAGSGKTRVLTDRVARLLLAGTEPQQHPLPHLHQGRRRRDADPAVPHPRRLGDAARRRAARRTDATSASPAARIPPDAARPRPHPVRPRAGDAGRAEDPDHPRLLRGAAAPLPARGRRRAAVRACSRTARPARCAPRCSTRWPTPARPSFAALARHLPGDDPDPLLQEIGRHRAAFAAPVRPRRPRRGPRRRSRPRR